MSKGINKFLPSVVEETRKLSHQAQRAQRPAEEHQHKRLSYIGIGIAIGVLLGVIGCSTANVPTPQAVERVYTFANIVAGHTEGPVKYEQTPPVGGPHAARWQNCGIYESPVQSENAVHSLEHGAVWLTYKSDLAAEQVEQLRSRARGQRYVLLSPYERLPAPIVASAWGAQLPVQAANDPRLVQFVAQYQRGPFAPEPGAPCVSGIGTPL